VSSLGVKRVRVLNATINMKYEHLARVVGYGPLSLCVIHKEGMWSNNGGINKPMMMKDEHMHILRVL
jgi:hypothetical protein